MRKKHFTALAMMLANLKPDARQHARMEQWRETVLETADVCARYNGAFDRCRFLVACGYEG